MIRCVVDGESLPSRGLKGFSLFFYPVSKASREGSNGRCVLAATRNTEADANWHIGELRSWSSGWTRRSWVGLQL
jgi:hypothetical protein